VSGCLGERPASRETPTPAQPPATTSSRRAQLGPPAVRALDRAALDTLVRDCRENGSDALLVLKDGELVADEMFSHARTPIQTMSITKSVLALAVGTLIDSGKLRVDEPVSDFYPDWQKGDKSSITLQHLLTHTSGLEEGKTAADIYRNRSFVEFSLRSNLLHVPGTHYEYSNRGANVVSGIVSKVSGMRADRYVAKALFEPLGISNYVWSLDRAGDAQGLAGLHLTPRDLAKIGELVLDGGVWHGRRVVSEQWIVRATRQPAPVQPTNKRLALFWWLVPEWSRVTVDDAIVEGWRAAGADEAFVEKAKPLVGRRFDSVTAFVAALRELFGDARLEEWNENTWKRGAPDARFAFGPVVGSYSAGTLGQYLVILPRDRLVAVRLRRVPKKPEERDDSRRTFPEFVERVQGLVH
jgi:CubicO group peptidase (beta-lactamase class C family)